jgi:hypothetical protein
MRLRLIVFITFVSIVSFCSKTQNSTKGVIFSCQYLKSNDSSLIHISVRNNTDTVLYYHIGAMGLVKDKWVNLILDLNALGKMDFARPVPINPRKTYSRGVSLREINEEFEVEKGKINRVQFFLFLYKKQKIDSPHEEIASQQFIMPQTRHK